MKNRERFYEIMQGASHIVFFGGAGVATESGIPDFRSQDGLYRQKYPYPPETMLSHSFFLSHMEEFFDFYVDKMVYPNAQPNAAHKKLAVLEAAGRLDGIITQNIDGLHQKAGSKNVIELHGSVLRNDCQRCGQRYGLDYVLTHRPIPRCSCGGVVKPDVVLYEEALDEGAISGAISLISQAEVLIIGGTSLTVYPAAGLVRYFSGKHLILINRDATPMDQAADLVLRENIGEIFARLPVDGASAK